jgi:hypothetical protein
LYIRAVIKQAGEPLRAIKKVQSGIVQAILLIEPKWYSVVTKEGRNKFINKEQANMFLRRV